jgi:hypothetical protein
LQPEQRNLGSAALSAAQRNVGFERQHESAALAASRAATTPAAPALRTLPRPSHSRLWRATQSWRWQGKPQ